MRHELQQLEDKIQLLEGTRPEGHDLLSLRQMIEEFRTVNTRHANKISETENRLQENGLASLAENEEKLRKFDANVRKEVTEFLSSEATSSDEVIMKSEAIHTCAFQTVNAYIELLLNFLPDDSMKNKAINYPDPNGVTPLMVTAAVAGATESGDHGKRLETCKFLLDRGADKDVQTRLGLIQVVRECNSSAASNTGSRDRLSTCLLLSGRRSASCPDKVTVVQTPTKGPRSLYLMSSGMVRPCMVAINMTPL
jgi:hypothetical protein